MEILAAILIAPLPLFFVYFAIALPIEMLTGKETGISKVIFFLPLFLVLFFVGLGIVHAI